MHIEGKKHAKRQKLHDLVVSPPAAVKVPLGCLKVGFLTFIQYRFKWISLIATLAGLSERFVCYRRFSATMMSVLARQNSVKAFSHMFMSDCSCRCNGCCSDIRAVCWCDSSDF